VEVMNCLVRYFELRNFSYSRLDGSTASEEREKGMFAFNDPNSPYFLFLLSTRAGGLGLNLATADTVIIFDRYVFFIVTWLMLIFFCCSFGSDWNPMADAQAQDRAHRIGQKNEVRVFRLITTTPVEERILSRANDKKNLTGLVVEAGKFNSTVDDGVDDNKELMESMLNEWITTGESMSGNADLIEDSDVPDDDQINEMMATYDGELELYQSIDNLRRMQTDHPLGLLDVSETPFWLSKDSCISKFAWLFFPPRNQEMLDKTLDSDLTLGESSSTQLRKRREVMYDDGLTDIQFMKRLEKDQDQDDLVKKSKKRPRSDIYGRVSETLQETVEQISKESYAELFRQKPSKQLYRDYYSVIKSPISLKEIVQKLKKSEYDYFEQLENDLALMSANARLYNGPENIVSLWAEDVRTNIYTMWRDRLKELKFFRALVMPTLPLGSFGVRTDNIHSMQKLN
jgi:hypothetical protein